MHWGIKWIFWNGNIANNSVVQSDDSLCKRGKKLLFICIYAPEENLNW